MIHPDDYLAQAPLLVLEDLEWEALRAETWLSMDPRPPRVTQLRWVRWGGTAVVPRRFFEAHPRLHGRPVLNEAALERPLQRHAGRGPGLG